MFNTKQKAAFFAVFFSFCGLGAMPALGDIRPNGGGGVICDQVDGTKTVTLLDYFEAFDPVNGRWGWTPDLGDGTHEYEKVLHVLDRLAIVDPDRAAKYRAKAQVFFVNTRFYRNVHFHHLDDTDLVPIPRNCTIEQIVVQLRPPLLPGDKLFNINEDLWTLLSLDDRAGMILHEIIYEEASLNGHQTSRKSRYFNGLISSKEFSATGLKSYLDLLRLVELPLGTRTVNGLSLKMDSLTFFSSGAVSSGILAGDATYTFPKQTRPLTFKNGSTVNFFESGAMQKGHLAANGAFSLFKGCDVEFVVDDSLSYFEFYEDGGLKSVPIARDFGKQEFCAPGRSEDDAPAHFYLGVSSERVASEDKRFELYPNGIVKGGYMEDHADFPVADQRMASLRDDVAFHFNGFPSLGTLTWTTMLLGDNGADREYQPGDILQFDTFGRVTAVVGK